MTALRDLRSVSFGRGRVVVTADVSFDEGLRGVARTIPGLEAALREVNDEVAEVYVEPEAHGPTRGYPAVDHPRRGRHRTRPLPVRAPWSSRAASRGGFMPAGHLRVGMPTVRTNGVETYYERRGEGPPVVFVHPSVMDHAVWDEQVAALSEEYETVVYDLRGHGRTGGSSERAYPMDLYAEDLRALVDALDLDRPVLCGLSRGGMVALTYAARYPDEVSGLVLAETFTPPILGLGDWFLRRVLLNAVIPPVRLVGYERVERAQVWFLERFGSGMAGNYGNVERAREGGPGVATDEFAKVMRSMTRFHETALDLSAVAAPTLVLYGERGLPPVKRHAARLAARLPDVEVDEVPGAGHAATLDDPAYVTDALRRLLARAYRDADVEEPTGDADPRSG